MAYTVMSPCVGTKDAACVKVCPVDCFFDQGCLLVIQPDECIVCDACVPECPVAAILPTEEVPEEEQKYIAVAAKFFAGKTPEELEAARMSA